MSLANGSQCSTGNGKAVSYRFLLINTSNNTLMHDVWFDGQILMIGGTIYEHIRS